MTMMTIGEQWVAINADNNKHRWLDKDESYWYYRLLEEVGELGSTLAGNHKDSVEHELRQIGGIVVNWLNLRQR